MLRTAATWAMYPVATFSWGYLMLRYVGGIGKCEDISMEPTIQHGDMFIHTQIPVDYQKVQKGDIVFCRKPKNAREVICKRVVAMEYDEVFNSDKGFSEFVDTGHVWLEGDNKEMSIDSRSYGQVPYGLLMSKVVFRIWPPSRIGRFSDESEEKTEKSVPDDADSTHQPPSEPAHI